MMSIGLVDYSDSEDICDSLNAISQSIARRDGWSDRLGKRYAVTHAHAYCGTLPPDDSIFYIMFLDFAPNRIASETLVTVYDDADEDGGRKTLKIRENNVSITEYVSLEDAISSVAVYAGEPPLSRIVLINPPPSLTPTLHATLSEIHQNVPIAVASASDISQALTKTSILTFLYAVKLLLFRCGFSDSPSSLRCLRHRRCHALSRPGWGMHSFKGFLYINGQSDNSYTAALVG